MGEPDSSFSRDALGDGYYIMRLRFVGRVGFEPTPGLPRNGF
jgi:hypothetical protein